VPVSAANAQNAVTAESNILIQTEKNGEAWYVHPANGKAYFLGKPADALKIMQSLALGAKHDFIANTKIFPQRLSGRILLDTEKNGEAYYIYPKDLKKYYLGRPADALKIMKEKGRGVTNSYLANIPVGAAADTVSSVNDSDAVLIAGVPFTIQAPLGDWKDPRQQEGCEESSALMAVSWARGESLTKEIALREITGISDWLLEKHGEFRDTSLEDSLNWIFKEYFNYSKVSLKKNITKDYIIAELKAGNLVITAINGQAVNNPHYRQPGPGRHMLVIRGYDPAKKEFITNDPGFGAGELYRYDAAALYAAMRDYPTGYYELIDEIGKNIIVIRK
jgi:hypothetical protein